MNLPKPLPPQRPQDKLRVSRLGLNLSVNALGVALGVSGSAINDWESGKSTPKLRAALLLDRLFGIDPRWWIEGLEADVHAARAVLAERQATNEEHASKGPEA